MSNEAGYLEVIKVVAKSLCGWRNGERSSVPFEELPKTEQDAYLEQASDAMSELDTTFDIEIKKKCVCQENKS